MLNPYFLMAVGTAVAASYLIYKRKQEKLEGLAAVTGENDADMKIVSGPISSMRRGEDAAELAARDFIKQKEAGNIDRARALGSRYAQALINIDKGLLSEPLPNGNPLIQHHLYLLFAFVVNHVIADHSPNSILSQTSLNVFFHDIEERSPQLSNHVNDMAAFSLYILAERNKNGQDDDYGHIFADQCGEEGNREMIQYGNSLYDRIYRYCVEEIRKAGYKDV